MADADPTLREIAQAIGELRTDMESGFKNVRAEMATEFKSVRSEIETLAQSTARQFATVADDLRLIKSDLADVKLSVRTLAGTAGDHERRLTRVERTLDLDKSGLD